MMKCTNLKKIKFCLAQPLVIMPLLLPTLALFVYLLEMLMVNNTSLFEYTRDRYFEKSFTISFYQLLYFLYCILYALIPSFFNLPDKENIRKKLLSYCCYLYSLSLIVQHILSTSTMIRINSWIFSKGFDVKSPPYVKELVHFTEKQYEAIGQSIGLLILTLLIVISATLISLLKNQASRLLKTGLYTICSCAITLFLTRAMPEENNLYYDFISLISSHLLQAGFYSTMIIVAKDNYRPLHSS